MKLEELQKDTSHCGIVPDSQVTVVNVQWVGSEALGLRYNTKNDKVASLIEYLDEDPDWKWSKRVGLRASTARV